MNADDILKRWQVNRTRTNEAIDKAYQGVQPYTEEELRESKATPYQDKVEQVDAKLRQIFDRVSKLQTAEQEWKEAFPSEAWTWELDEHPEGNDGWCMCQECRSYWDD